MRNIFIIMVLFLSVPCFAGTDGHGGGGFCFDTGTCITLAESGFRIQDSVTYDKPPVTMDIFNEMARVVNSLPIDSLQRNIFIKKSIGNAGIYKKILSYNEETLKKIKAEYIKILTDHNMSSENLVIYALSNSDTTYLLPEFYKLNLRSQALILIHESVVRDSGSILKALKLDGAILDALNGQDKTQEIIEGIVQKSEVPDLLFKNYIQKYLASGKKYLRFVELSPSGEPCLSAMDESNLYNRYNDVWRITNRYNFRCFEEDYIIDYDSILENIREFGIATLKEIIEEGPKVCAHAKNGKVITNINLYKYGEVKNKSYSTKPLMLECKDGKVQYLFELGF